MSTVFHEEQVPTNGRISSYEGVLHGIDDPFFFCCGLELIINDAVWSINFGTSEILYYDSLILALLDVYTNTQKTFYLLRVYSIFL